MLRINKFFFEKKTVKNTQNHFQFHNNEQILFEDVSTLSFYPSKRSNNEWTICNKWVSYVIHTMIAYDKTPRKTKYSPLNHYTCNEIWILYSKHTSGDGDGDWEKLIDFGRRINIDTWTWFARVHKRFLCMYLTQ